MTEPAEQPIALLPCPFCGVIPDLSVEGTINYTDSTKYGAVICCCTGPEVRTHYRPIEEWRDKAIAQWNDRVQAPQAEPTQQPVAYMYTHNAVSEPHFVEAKHRLNPGPDYIETPLYAVPVAQPEPTQEPYGYLYVGGTDKIFEWPRNRWARANVGGTWGETPLYAAPVAQPTDKELDQALQERDRAQDALLEASMIMGGPEWCGKLPPQPPPNSGDLHLDVPELCRQLVALVAQPERDSERVKLLEALKEVAKVNVILHYTLCQCHTCVAIRAIEQYDAAAGERR